MRKQWQQKKAAIRSLNYFNYFNEDQVTNIKYIYNQIYVCDMYEYMFQVVRACAYCQLEQYDPLHSIYSEDRGAVSCVHFILSGECVVLQCLKVIVSTDASVYSIYIYIPLYSICWITILFLPCHAVSESSNRMAQERMNWSLLRRRNRIFLSIQQNRPDHSIAHSSTKPKGRINIYLNRSSISLIYWHRHRTSTTRSLDCKEKRY